MAVTIDVPYSVLSAAKAEWDEAADELDGSFRRLVTASTSGLSPTATAAVDTFRQRWGDELKACGQKAQMFSDAFLDTGNDFLITDTAQARLMRSVLPWAFHDARIEGR
jgi:hypothetical protein